MAKQLIVVLTILAVLCVLTTVDADFSNAVVHHQSADQLMRIRGLKERWGQVEVRMSSSDPTWYPVCYNARVFFGRDKQGIANWICETRLGLTVSYAEVEIGRSTNASVMKAECPNNRTCTFSLGSECRSNRTVFVYCPAPGSGELSLRLTGGPDERRGNLEIVKNGEWGPLCGGFFSVLNAQVACRQMGYNASLANLYTVEKKPVKNVTIRMIRCQGNESRLIDCIHLVLGLPGLSCEQSAGVECRANDDYSPRLGDSRNFTAANGRLDLKVAGQWRALCGDISNTTASVACRQMGLPSSFSRMLPANVEYLSQTIPNITLRIHCSGSESRLQECEISHKSDICEETFGIVCSDDPGYEVRLVGGDNSRGRLEVKIAGIWGTVCNTLFFDDAAGVICRQLGFHNALPLVWPTKSIGQADPQQPMWLPYLYCEGREDSLKDCHHKFEHIDTCSNKSDVIVSCKSMEDLDIPIRLAGGPDNTTGRLEVFFDGQWGTVCRYYLSIQSPRVACRQLGLPYNAAELTRPMGDPPTGPIWLANLKCTGEESHIMQCRHLPINTSDCDPRRDAYIKCQNYADILNKNTKAPESSTVESKAKPSSGGAKTVPFDPFMFFFLALVSSTCIFRVSFVRLVSGIMSVVVAMILGMSGCRWKKFNELASYPGRDESIVLLQPGIRQAPPIPQHKVQTRA